MGTYSKKETTTSYLEICEIRFMKIHSPMLASNHLFAQIFDSYYDIGAKLWFMETDALLGHKNKWSKKKSAEGAEFLKSIQFNNRNSRCLMRLLVTCWKIFLIHWFSQKEAGNDANLKTKGTKTALQSDSCLPCFFDVFNKQMAHVSTGGKTALSRLANW